MSRWNMAWLLGFVAAALTGISLTYSAPARDAALQKKHDNLRLLVDVLDEVQRNYVKDLDPDKMRELVENMISGGLERLDPHSSFINADEYRQFQKNSKGRFGGIGIRIGVDRAGQVFVESPMVGTPAYEAGVMAGDIILKIDDKATDSMPLKKVVEMIQGEPGTTVKLTVLHESPRKTEDIPVKRADIKVDSILGDQRTKDNQEWDFWVDPVRKIGYIRVNAFTETTSHEMVEVVKKLQDSGMQGLIVDLRNNPGGLLRSAVEVSSVFLPEGKPIVTTKGRKNVEEHSYASKPPANIKQSDFPVAVLINRYSASASEIVAAALQDHFRAVIVGERSFGKGSVQNIIGMEGGTSALKLTTSSYWRPSNKNIHRFPDSKEEDDWGVQPTPKYEVKLTDEERAEYFKWRRDRDIVRRPGQEPKKEDEKLKNFTDKVLNRGLDYVREELDKKNKNAQAPIAPMPVPQNRVEARAEFDQRQALMPARAVEREGREVQPLRR